MNTAPNSRRPALLCAFVLLVCAFATFPFAEVGLTDDWSYVQSARVLAQTGHIVYNGWATAMLGWQLYLGALFVKLFGTSFTAVRASTLLVALITAFLMQRTFVRAGINSRNATIGTLALVLSPLFLPGASGSLALERMQKGSQLRQLAVYCHRWEGKIEIPAKSGRTRMSKGDGESQRRHAGSCSHE